MGDPTGGAALPISIDEHQENSDKSRSPGHEDHKDGNVHEDPKDGKDGEVRAKQAAGAKQNGSGKQSASAKQTKEPKPTKRSASAKRAKQAKRPKQTEGNGAATPVKQSKQAKRLKRELKAERKKYRRLEKRNAREAELQPYQVELIKLQRHLEQQGMKMIVLFEGRDAAGKGGTIRRVTRYMNEKHYRVVALGKPTNEQRGQWYLQKYVAQFPRAGEIVLFDRSWYNRAMVEPVFGFCTPKEHEDFLRGVVGFEKDLVRQGTVLVKLYFSVTKKEQKRRFERRRDDPLRQWKLSEIDVQAQDLWDDFTERKYEMLDRTHTHAAPWTIIRSGSKHRARVNAMRVILDAVDYADRDLSLDFVPDPEIVVSGAHEVELMEAERIRKGKFSA